MRKIYIAVLAIFISSIFLFMMTLFYLDKEKHRIYTYTLNLDGYDAGTIKIDRFVTEDKLIYKSASALPFQGLFTGSDERITLDRNYNLASYSKEDTGGGARKTAYLENNNNNISFVATSNSEFAVCSDIPIKQGTFIFKEDSPVTYLPILENYNFRLGRAQAFNVLMGSGALLPPMKKLLTLTSIRNEYIKIGSRKIKVECLLIRMRDRPQGMLWVTKSGRALVKIEFPDKKIRLMRTFLPKTFSSNEFNLKSTAYREEEVKFNSGNISLKGTLTIPAKETPKAAVLLLGGNAAGDRQNNGLFTYIADTLGKKGYMALRFDKRGMAASGGDPRSTTDTMEYGDANAALNYLLSIKGVEPQKAAVIGHGKGAFFAAKLATERKDIRVLILMSPLISLGGETDLNFDNLNEMASKLKWDEQYLKLAMKSRMETIEKVKKVKNKQTTLLRTRCFLQKLREELEENPTDIIRKVEIPVLILHGKADEFISAKSAAMLDKALEDSGNKNHKLIYYGYLGHFFGKRIFDGVNREYYQADKAVLEAISDWLEKIDLTLPASYDILPVNKPKKGGE